ncbi:hypothetical protein A3D91_01855 [candidate division WWE3 bacterium RIFCSPHIGHO2_02_FULL_38_14]|uniref:Uncharacterized protein n=1 Tax=candidate division WWE3 bacterium RIFCSPHIGHO2_02_FULL_38_14 TaxID=1802620 RepID=A0A1F4V7B5_UNCKA|nr:MAG: hypothetical protein A3D91_01855 [candidate division WWE3 bacterium RIFCSPHIGHO2_02_FULL_38_14]
MLSHHKSGDTFKVGVIRYLLAAMKNKEIELRPQHEDLTDEEAMKVIKKQMKQRNDSIENYKMGNRQDLVDQETAELKVLEEYFNMFSKELGVSL